MAEEIRRWEDLPHDCLVDIFSRLGLEDVSLALPFVCKPWHDASLDPQCWRCLDMRDLDFSSGSKLVFSSFMKLCIARSRGAAAELAVPFILGASLLQDLASASVECPRLKLLALPSLLRKDDKELPGLVSCWKELEILEITWKPNSFMEILEQIRVNCPNFVGLHLCGFFDSEEAMAIVRCLPKLKILVMSGSFLRKEDLLVILEGCKELEVVDVSKCRGFDADDDDILKMSATVKKFECGGCKLEENHTNLYYDYDDVFMALAIINY